MCLRACARAVMRVYEEWVHVCLQISLCAPPSLSALDPPLERLEEEEESIA